ncbi:LOB domain-containing protein 15-like [Chenopodium quinoa]|uniref:LOB domain-containing protein 15-like n=1 Tax=Chenopodium quinoa TaxID=63459 RepID=UPI000B78DC03|nr:LOB domain-containing protein 15-like [Chenopodium quinoa]
MSRERERFDEIGKKIKRDNDAISRGGGGGGGGRRHFQLGPPGTLNTITPCAACKLLRRRCAQECPFSPYFSPHEPQKFASVHKVFGASNVSKMLMEVPESQRADAANSLVYEANVRLRDPVYGCMGAISALQQQVQLLQAELNAVRAEILKYKFRDTNNNHNHNHNNNNNISTSTNNNNNNNNPSPSSHHDLSFFSSGAPVSVSIAVPPPLTPSIPPPSPPPPPLPPPLHSIPRDSSISSSMYTHEPSSSSNPDHDHFSSISNENISYFG